MIKEFNRNNIKSHQASLENILWFATRWIINSVNSIFMFNLLGKLSSYHNVPINGFENAHSHINHVVMKI